MSKENPSENLNEYEKFPVLNVGVVKEISYRENESFAKPKRRKKL